MTIIPLINEITNDFNEIFKNNLSSLNLESKIRNAGDLFTLRLYEYFLNFFDERFKKSEERKKEFNIKETRKRTLITSIGVITINSTSYINKETGASTATICRVSKALNYGDGGYATAIARLKGE